MPVLINFGETQGDRKHKSNPVEKTLLFYLTGLEDGKLKKKIDSVKFRLFAMIKKLTILSY